MTAASSPRRFATRAQDAAKSRLFSRMIEALNEAMLLARMIPRRREDDLARPVGLREVPELPVVEDLDLPIAEGEDEEEAGHGEEDGPGPLGERLDVVIDMAIGHGGP